MGILHNSLLFNDNVSFNKHFYLCISFTLLVMMPIFMAQRKKKPLMRFPGNATPDTFKRLQRYQHNNRDQVI
jgi:hypothetical protein